MGLVFCRRQKSRHPLRLLAGNSRRPQILQERTGEDKILQDLIVTVEDLMLVAPPRNLPFVQQDDIVTDAHDRIHVVGIDDGRDIVFNGDIADELVDHDRSLGVEARVGLITEQVGGLQHDRTGNAYPLLHTTTDFGGVPVIGTRQIDPLEAKIYAIELFLSCFFGKHIQRETDILFDRHRIEQSRGLKKHAHLHTHTTHILAVELKKVDIVVKYLPGGRLEEAHQQLEQYRLAGAGAADDKIGMPAEKLSRNTLEDLLLVELFAYVYSSDHGFRILLSKQSSDEIIEQQDQYITEYHSIGAGFTQLNAATFNKIALVAGYGGEQEGKHHRFDEHQPYVER